MQLNDLQSTAKRKTKARVGRGGKRGKTSGRGMKGQRARAGHHIRPEVRDAIKKLPKKRGHGKNRARTVNSGVKKPLVVNIADLEKLFADGEAVTPSTLRKKGLVRVTKGGNYPVKILGHGVLNKKITISSCSVSDRAKAAIEKAGGAVAE